MVIYLHSVQMSLDLRAQSCVVHPEDFISVFILADLSSPLTVWPFMACFTPESYFTGRYMQVCTDPLGLIVRSINMLMYSSELAIRKAL